MKKETLKSIWAVFAGFAATGILSMLMDLVLQKTGVMKTDPFVANPVWLIATIILYRTIFNTFGFYVTARIAPDKPMKHVLILATICIVLSLGMLVVMWNIPPRWYPVSLMLLTLPAAWLGGKSAQKVRAK